MEISRFTGHWANLSVASSFRNQKVICPLSGRFHYVRKIQLERIGPSPVNGETINSFHNPLGYRELWKIVPLRLQDTPPASNVDRGGKVENREISVRWSIKLA